MSNISLLKDFFYTVKGIYLYNVMLKKSCYWSPDKIAKFQFVKLKNLLCESYENVPFYNQLFYKNNFNPICDFNSLDDINKIPILDKETAKENSSLLINPKFLKGAISFKTSGSTGVPFEEFVHPNQWVMEQGVVWRHWKWGGYGFRDPLAMIRSFVPTSDTKLWKTNYFSNFTYFSTFHLSDKVMAEYLDMMIVRGITVLRGYPSSIASLARFVLRTGHDIPKIKLILTASEILFDQDRKLIEEAFGAKVSNHYGLAEQVVMMGDCEKHEGLHNYEEYGYLELLDTEDPFLKRIIGTNLHNLTMPLIRYDTGDLAVVSDKPCSCGRTLRTIKNVIGRKDSVIKTLNGYVIPITNFYTMLEHFQEIDRWQIVQHSLTEIEFIFSSKNITIERIRHLENEIKRRLNNNFEVIISSNSSFIQKSEGKINPFISLL